MTRPEFGSPGRLRMDPNARPLLRRLHVNGRLVATSLAAMVDDGVIVDPTPHKHVAAVADNKWAERVIKADRTNDVYWSPGLGAFEKWWSSAAERLSRPITDQEKRRMIRQRDRQIVLWTRGEST